VLFIDQAVFQKVRGVAKTTQVSAPWIFRSRHPPREFFFLQTRAHSCMVRLTKAKPPATANKRLAEQTRKILGKHYASKYRVR
jgi:hypothetical protein